MNYKMITLTSYFQQPGKTKINFMMDRTQFQNKEGYLSFKEPLII